MDIQHYSNTQYVLLLLALLMGYLVYQSIRRLRVLDGLITLTIGAVVVLLLFFTIAIQVYMTGTGADILVAKVKATSFSNVTNQLSVDLTLYDSSGKVTSENTYAVLGNEWTLQADVVKVAPVLGMLDIHSGFKLTRLEGRYDDDNLERTAKHTVVDLNGGEDELFRLSRQWNGVIYPFIDATYGNVVMAGNGTYNIFASQTNLWAKGA